MFSRSYCFRFKTTQELYEVMRSAAQRYCIEDRSALPDSLSERDLSKKLIREVLTALRLFVNDGPNQLYFAINEVAKNFLKPPSETSPGGKIPAQNCRATFFACTDYRKSKADKIYKKACCIAKEQCTDGWECDLGFWGWNFFCQNGLGGFLGPHWKVFHQGTHSKHFQGVIIAFGSWPDSEIRVERG